MSNGKGDKRRPTNEHVVSERWPLTPAPGRPCKACGGKQIIFKKGKWTCKRCASEVT